MIDLQDGVLLHHAEEHEHAQRRVEVDGLVHQPEREERERNRERKREQNRQRMNDVLKLGRENEVHQDDREQERPDEFIERCLQLARSAGDPGRVFRRQIHRGHFGLERCDAVCLREARRNGRTQPHLSLPVNAIDARCRLAGHDANHVVEAHQTATLLRHVEARDGFRIVAVAFLQTKLHVVVVAHRFITEAGNLLIAANQQAERVGDVLGVHAELGGAFPIDLHAQLGLVEAKSRIGIDQAELRRFLAQLFGVERQAFEVRPHQREVDVVVRPAEAERLRVADRDAEVAELPEALAHLHRDISRRIVALEGAPRRPLQKTLPRKHALGMRREADVVTRAVDAAHKPTSTRRHEHETNRGNRAQLLLDAQRDAIHGFETRTLRCRHVDVELAFVHVAGDIFLPHHFVQGERRGHHQ